MMKNGITHKSVFGKTVIQRFLKHIKKKAGKSKMARRNWEEDEERRKLWDGTYGYDLGKMAVSMLKECRNQMSVRVKTTVRKWQIVIISMCIISLSSFVLTVFEK